MHIRPFQRMVMVGKNFSANECAVTLKRTSDCNAESPATTTSTDRSERGRAEGKRRRQQFAAKSSKPSYPASTRLKSGATVTGPEASCTSMTAPREPGRLRKAKFTNL